MAELRSVDPSTLTPNPNNPRKTAASAAMDEQLIASIRAVGIIQPPRVSEVDGRLTIIAGGRRTRAAIAAGFDPIDVLVCEADEAGDAMRSLSENLVRASMGSVDIWRATQTLEKQGWTEQAIADAFAMPLRRIRQLKLLAHLPASMLTVIASGDMPNDNELRIIAHGSPEEQAQVWKKHKPKRGEQADWWTISRALAKRHIPFSAASFDDELARAYGVQWVEDLFAPADKDGRYTTNVEGFFGAQQEWMQQHLPERATILQLDEHGSPALPKKAQRVYGEPGRDDVVGYYVDQRTGEIANVAYRMPEAKKPAKVTNGSDPTSASETEEVSVTSGTGVASKSSRPDINGRGIDIIGALRTDALHDALRAEPIDDVQMIGLLVLALSGSNVQVQSPGVGYRMERTATARAMIAGGLITTDAEAVRAAARSTLTGVLSCREGISGSGPFARVAAATIGAERHLPNMATEEFLSTLTKTAIELEAAAAGLRVEVRGKDTRAGMIAHFKHGRYVHPAALFDLKEAELRSQGSRFGSTYVPGIGGHGDTSPADADGPDVVIEDGDAEGAEGGESTLAEHEEDTALEGVFDTDVEPRDTDEDVGPDVLEDVADDDGDLDAPFAGFGSAHGDYAEAAD